MWDVEARGETAGLKGATHTVLAVAFSPDGTRLAVGEQRGTLTVWTLGRR